MASRDGSLSVRSSQSSGVARTALKGWSSSGGCKKEDPGNGLPGGVDRQIAAWS